MSKSPLLYAVVAGLFVFSYRMKSNQKVGAVSSAVASHLANSYSSRDVFVSGDFFREISNVVVYSNRFAHEFAKNLKVEPYSIIFLKTDYLRFLPGFQSRNRVPYVLITHDSAFSAPQKQHKCLNDPNLIQWFAQNTDRSHVRLTTLPLGIANAHWPHGNQTVLLDIRKTISKVADRKPSLYVNFSNRTNSNRGGLMNKICSQKELNVNCVTTRRTWPEYLLEVADSQFVLSPPGRGIDCHRTWESLALGSIPIVLNTTISSVYKDEKVLAVNSFDEITPQLLRETLEKFSSEQFHSAGKLYRTYWIENIQQAILKHARKKLL